MSITSDKNTVQITLPVDQALNLIKALNSAIVEGVETEKPLTQVEPSLSEEIKPSPSCHDQASIPTALQNAREVLGTKWVSHGKSGLCTLIDGIWLIYWPTTGTLVWRGRTYRDKSPVNVRRIAIGLLEGFSFEHLNYVEEHRSRR